MVTHSSLSVQCVASAAPAIASRGRRQRLPRRRARFEHLRRTDQRVRGGDVGKRRLAQHVPETERLGAGEADAISRAFPFDDGAAIPGRAREQRQQFRVARVLRVRRIGGGRGSAARPSPASRASLTHSTTLPAYSPCASRLIALRLDTRSAARSGERPPRAAARAITVSAPWNCTIAICARASSSIARSRAPAARQRRRR